ncbi:MAG: DUF4383 domain-containing protein [Anaerolineales bacterium]|nr:DUF4383 domain-containing protein [Anaerolineales bacterium]
MNNIFKLPSSQQDWAVLYCKVMSLFVLQGIIILVIYSMRGFDADPDSLPPLMKLDPMHGVIHLVTGLIGTYFAFWKPSGALNFLRVFTIFYLGLAILGTFTNTHFGMQLEIEENLFHWPLSLLAAAIAFGMNLLPKKA